MALDNKQIMTYESLGKVLDYIDKGDSVRVVKYNESITDIKKAVNFSNGVQTLMNIKGFVGTLDGKSYTFLGDIPYVGDESGNPVFRGISLAKRTDSVLGDIFEPLDVEFKYDGGTTQYKMSSVERIQDNTTVNYLDSVAKINDTCNASGEGLVTMNVTDMPIEIDSVDMILQGAIPAIEVSDDNWFFHGYAVAKDGSTPPVETPCDVVVKYDTTENKYVATAKKLGSTEWELYECHTKIDDNGEIALVHYMADEGEDTEEWLKKITLDVIAGKMVQVSIKGKDRLDNDIRTIVAPYFNDDEIMLSFIGNGGEIATSKNDGEVVSSQPYGMFYVGMGYDGTFGWQEYYPVIPVGGINRVIGVAITDDGTDVGIEYSDNVLEDIYGEANLERIAHSLASMWSPENGMNIIYPDEYLNDRYIPELALYLDTNKAPYDDPSFDNMRGKSLQFEWVGSTGIIDPVTHVLSIEEVFSNSYGEVVFVLTLTDPSTMGFSASLEIRPAKTAKPELVQYEFECSYSMDENKPVLTYSDDESLTNEKLEAVVKDALAGKNVFVKIHQFGGYIYAHPVIEKYDGGATAYLVGNGNTEIPIAYSINLIEGITEPYGCFIIDVSDDWGVYAWYERSELQSRYSSRRRWDLIVDGNSWDTFDLVDHTWSVYPLYECIVNNQKLGTITIIDGENLYMYLEGHYDENNEVVSLHPTTFPAKFKPQDSDDWFTLNRIEIRLTGEIVDNIPVMDIKFFGADESTGASNKIIIDGEDHTWGSIYVNGVDMTSDAQAFEEFIKGTDDDPVGAQDNPEMLELHLAYRPTISGLDVSTAETFSFVGMDDYQNDDGDWVTDYIFMSPRAKATIRVLVDAWNDYTFEDVIVEPNEAPDEYVKKIVKSNDGSFITITPNTGDPFTFSASGSGGGVTMEQVDAEIALKTYSKTESDGKYVAQVAGKGLSTNDYTTTEKTKLAGIEEQAQKNVQSDWNATSGDSFIKNKPSVYTKTEVDTELAKKVDKVTGKDLSTNDFTNALKTKLDDLYTKAQLDTEFAKKVDKTADDYLTKAELITDGIKITPNKGSAIEYKLNEYVEKAEMTSENLVKITQHDGTTVEQKPYLAKVETIQVDGLDEYKITDNKGVETKLDVYKRADTFGRDEDAVPTDTTTYGKKQIDDMINALEGVTMKVVTSVPTPATAVAGTIYICDGTMYLCYENAGSKVVTPIGGTAPDLTQYWKKTDGDLMSTAEHTKLTQDYTKAEVDTELAKKLNVDDAYVVKAELDSAKRLKLTDSAGGVVTQNSFIEKVEKDTNKLKLTNNAGGVVTQEDFLMKVEEVATGYKFTRSDNTTSTFLKITDAEWADITDYIDEKIDELV